MEGILTAFMIFKELFSIGFQEFPQEKTEKNKNVLNELNIRKPFNSKNELNELSKVKKNISQKYFLKELVKDLEEIISIHALQITPKTFHEIDFISIQKMRDEQIFEALNKFKNDKKNKKSEEKPLDDFDNLFEKENIPSPINEIMGKKDRNTKSAKSNEEQMQEDVNTDEDDEDKIFSMDFNKMGKYKEKQSPLKEDNLKINNEIRDISENDFLSPEKSTSPEIIGRKINKKRNNPLREPIRGSVITNNKMKSSDNQANSSPTPKRQKGHLNNKSTSDRAIKVAAGKKKKANKRVTFKFSPKLSKSP
uniref:NET domain-containing protein n=1 Tax=Meloidogyne hapla TaxID=6305 RepID=A0A1I8BQS8_MELHA